MTLFLPPPDPIPPTLAPPHHVEDDPGSALAATVVPHPHLRIAHDRAMEVLTSPADHPFVLVVGPGGVGKSALIRTIDNALAYESRHAMGADPSFRPAIIVEAPASWTGRFNFPALWERILVAAEAPAVDRLTGDSVVALGIRAGVNGRRGEYGRDMYRLAAQACRDRGVRTVLLDEANHLSVLAGSARAPEQLDVLKDFARAAGVRILLVGAFPALAVRDISFQIGRRFRTVPFLGYDAAVAREREAFANAATAMLELMEGIDVTPDEALIDRLHTGSVGCIGSLRNWLVQAEHHISRAAGRRSLAVALRETAYPASTLRQAVAEIEQGRKTLAGDRPAPATRGYVAPRTASGQALLPGEARPVRREMEATGVA